MDSKVSEKDMREVYFQAFGKEYDSADRKQAPLPLEIAYLMALNKLKREGKYAGGGEITDDSYFQSVNHFIYFCMNYPNNFLDAFGSLKTHLSNKFKNYYNKYGTYGVMIQFYAELDSENRRILTDYSLKNYKGTPISSDISEVEYFNSVNHFIFFCFNFPSNFMDAFSSHLKVHISSKWVTAYEKKGSVGAMIYFWSELDNQNRRKLADWVKNNYTGTKLYEVGGALGDVAGMLPSPLPMSTIQAMAKGGKVSENAQICYSIGNDSYGNLELGYYDVSFKNEVGTTTSHGSFYKIDDAFSRLFDYLKGEDGQYIMSKDPKSNFYIEELSYDGKSKDYDGYAEIKRKNIFKISAKRLKELISSNNFKNGGGVEPNIYFYNDGEQDITFTNFQEAYNEVQRLGYSKFRDNLGGEYFVNKDLSKKTIYQHKSNPYITFEFLEDTNKGVKGLQKNSKSLSKKERTDGIIVYYSNSEMKQLFDKIYSDGGGVKSDYYIFEGVDNLNGNPLYRVESTSDSENEYVGEWHTDKSDAEKELKSFYADGGEIVDLFEDYENIPANVQEVLDRYSDKFGVDFGEMDYNDMAEMQKDIEKLGYTFDSGLDNQPYGLRPIGVELNQLRGYEEYGLGGFLLGAGVGIAGSYLYNNAKVEKNKDGVKFHLKKPKKVFKYGGEIEERVKDKLSRNFALPFEVVVYVPSTQDADTTISEAEFKNRIIEVETYLAKLFGGFSSNPVDGGYNSDEKGLIKEDVFKVFSFASRDGFEPKIEELVIQIKKWCKVWGQEAIGLEFEGDLFYVEA
jgi:hypothetical protein